MQLSYILFMFLYKVQLRQTYYTPRGSPYLGFEPTASWS